MSREQIITHRPLCSSPGHSCIWRQSPNLQRTLIALKLHESTPCVTQEEIHKLFPPCIISINLWVCCRRLTMSCSTVLWHHVTCMLRRKTCIGTGTFVSVRESNIDIPVLPQQWSMPTRTYSLI